MRFFAPGGVVLEVWAGEGLHGSYTVDEVEDDPHCHAELLEIQHAIIVDIGQVPDPFKLVIPQLAVLENGGRLGTIQVCAAICKWREDFPVLLDFGLFYSLRGHCSG